MSDGGMLLSAVGCPLSDERDNQTVRPALCQEVGLPSQATLAHSLLIEGPFF